MNILSKEEEDRFLPFQKVIFGAKNAREEEEGEIIENQKKRLKLEQQEIITNPPKEEISHKINNLSIDNINQSCENDVFAEIPSEMPSSLNHDRFKPKHRNNPTSLNSTRNSANIAAQFFYEIDQK